MKAGVLFLELRQGYFFSEQKHALYRPARACTLHSILLLSLSLRLRLPLTY